ncbi:acyl-CoA thioesterase/bile acid-CoA:amino acid N-acyltransferase family protein [Kitasatospora sp. NPDC002040]|uniref:acyl-CoA thioesterase/bile acid-CoA:amino acid N-acyltransferase family protein n=1 Tax=Kitasatospora sp. NPDC002040 TaxID=3154661 RepID=UPI0033252061
MARTGWVRLSVAALVLVLAGGCTDAPDGARPAPHPVSIEADHPDALADQAVRLRITGLEPQAEVTVTARTTDYLDTTWQAQATFVADQQGTVDLSTTAPRSGSYQGVDGMGLFWAMNPSPAEADGAYFITRYPQLEGSYQVHLTVDTGGRQQAARALERRWTATGVTARRLTLAADGVTGELFRPPPGPARRPAVLVFGGSEGGTSQNFTAALLASHGYPALSLGYFALPGLPPTLQDVPLEYFATAARLLAAETGADPARLLAMGYSRGSEAALLLAQHYPDLVHGTVVYAPAARVHAGFPSGPTAWTLGGAPVPTGTIPLDRVTGPVLAIAGADDELWPSADSAEQIARAIAPDGPPHRALVYPGAGHLVGTFPYLAMDTTPANTAAGRTNRYGGTRAGNAAAQAAGWRQVLALLAGLRSG